MWCTKRLSRGFVVAMLALVALSRTTLALAEDDPPGRVGRLADLQGNVSVYEAEQGQWAPASRNRPLTSGDRLSTDADGRAELRIGSTTLRLAAGSELEVLRLDDDRVSVQLHSGSVALRVRSREVADETEIVTAEARLRPLRGGHFRVDRVDDSTFATSWRGELRVDDGGDPFTIDGGRRAEIWREGGGRELRHSWTSVPDDAFAGWALREDQRDERSASNKYVSPEMTGAEDLDRDGRWEQHPEFGAVWIPLSVQAGWAPYRFGHWAWIRPWGWTWVDDARWGFAPFHYGRWVSWGGRWCWSPGRYVARPVYAPALVAWVGGPHLSVSISVGGPALPAVGWVPLAPREVFVPYYRASPVYGDRVNHQPPGRPRPPVQVPTGPIMYGNQGVPGAVTMVPRDVLVRREPVARAVIDLRNREPLQRAPVTPAAAPEGPPIMAAVPGRGPVPVRGRPGIAPQAPAVAAPQADRPAPAAVEPVAPRPVRPGQPQLVQPQPVQPQPQAQPQPQGRQQPQPQQQQQPQAQPQPQPQGRPQPQPQREVVPAPSRPPAVVDLRQQQQQQQQQQQPQPQPHAQQPERPAAEPRQRQDRPERQERPEPPNRPAAQPPAAAPQAAPAPAPAAAPAPAPAARPKPAEQQREPAREEGRQHAPESRKDMREREQNR